MDASASRLAGELLQHEDFLRRLARALVGGAEADDLVQEVWQRALAHPPAEGAPPRAWLARVARNLASNRRRGEARRREREERAAAPEAQPDPAAELERRFELRQRVVQALDGLDEPFRGTLLLRYFEALSLEEIALRQGVPLATAKSRHLRALEKLRAALDARCGRREEWLGALAGWLRADEKAGTGLAVARSATSGLRLLSLGAGLALVGALAALFLSRRGPELVPAPSLPVETAIAPPELLAEPPRLAAARAELRAAALADPGALHGLVYDDAGEPVTRFRVVAAPASLAALLGQPPAGDATALAVEDAGGRFTLAGLAAGEWDLYVESAQGWKAERTRVALPGDGAVHEFLLVRPALLAGSVLDPAGRAVAGAKVVYALGGLGETTELVATTDRDGRFAGFEVPAGPVHLHARASGWASSEVLSLSVPPAERRDGLVLVLRQAARLACQVLDGNGAPERGREVRVSGPLLSRTLAADEDGRFELEGLAPGAYALATVPTYEELSAPEFDERTGWNARVDWLRRTLAVTLAPGANESVVLGGVRPEPVRIRGTIRRAGLPLADVSIQAKPASTVAYSAVDGSFAIETEASGKLVLALWPGGGSYWEEVREVPPSGARLDFELPAAEVGGRIVGADGRPLAKVDVSLYQVVEDRRPDEARCGGFERTGEDGRFRFTCVRAGRYELKAVQYAGPHAAQVRALTVAEGSATVLELGLPLAGKIRGTVRAGGKVSPLPDVLAFDASGARSEAMREKGGGYSFRCLVPGTYRVLALTSDGASELSAPLEVASGATVELDLALEPGTRVRARALDARGEPLEARVSIFDAGGRELFWRHAVGRGPGTVPELDVRLPRGEYRVTAWSDDERSVSVPLRLVGQPEEDVVLGFER